MKLKLKRYVLLAWNDYYPSAGLGNVKATFDTLPDLWLWAAANVVLGGQWDSDVLGESYNHIEIHDIVTGELVEKLL